MAKTTKTTDKVTDTADTAVKNGTAAFKNGFEKAAKGYDHFLTYGKDTAEAYLKSANAAGKGLETLHQEIYGFSKQSIEDSITATKAVLGSKSIHEAIEVQTDFAKTSFDAYVGQMTKLGQLFQATSKETFAPIQGRVQAWVDVVQSRRAA